MSTKSYELCNPLALNSGTTRRSAKNAENPRKNHQPPHRHTHRHKSQSRTASAAPPNVFSTSGTMRTCRNNNGHVNNLAKNCTCGYSTMQTVCVGKKITSSPGTNTQLQRPPSTSPTPLTPMINSSTPLLQRPASTSRTPLTPTKSSTSPCSNAQQARHRRPGLQRRAPQHTAPTPSKHVIDAFDTSEELHNTLLQTQQARHRRL